MSGRVVVAVALALALCAVDAVARTLWLVEHQSLTRVDPDAVTVDVAPLATQVRHIAAAGAAGAWILADRALVRIDEAMREQARSSLDAQEAAHATALASQSDGTVWLATSDRLIHIGVDGARLVEWVLDEPALALAIAGPDAILVAARDTLSRYDASGRAVARVPLSSVRGTGSRALLLDSLAGYAWLVRDDALVQVDLLAGLVPRVTLLRPAPEAIALRVGSGELALLADRNVVRVDRDGRVGDVALTSEPLVEPAGIDAHERSPLLWFGDATGFGAIDPASGLVLRRSGGEPVRRFSATPVRVMPALQGGVTLRAELETTLTFEIGAACDGQPCGPLAGAERAFRLHAVQGGRDMTDVFALREPGRAWVGRVPIGSAQSAAPLLAWVSDGFGNRSDAVIVTWPAHDVAVHQQALAKAAPTIAITAPANGALFTAPLSTTVRATAAPGTGATITKVEFFAGPTLLGTVTTSPYDLAWANVQPGAYSVTAKVTDSLNATATSGVVNVTVNAGTPARPIDAWRFDDAWAPAGVATDSAGTHNAVPTGTVTSITSADLLLHHCHHVVTFK